ncbi:MAG: aminotransferase class V-fold PLP-dependent enzyme [Sphingomicrobium sp.]
MSKPDRLYLDHAATTPVLGQARAAMAEALADWANPSSPHGDGRRARAALEAARRAIATELDWRHDVIFTSGASEAIEMAARRVGPARRVLGSTEHDAVIAAMGGAAMGGAAMGEGATVLPVDGNGLIDLDALDAALASGPAQVAIQLVNNETGVIQPIDRIADMVRGAGSMLLCDCAQAAGKIALAPIAPLDADFVAISGHKFGGPPGAGALLARDLALLSPSGGQERGYRRGTENLPAAAGMAAALVSRAFIDALPRLAWLRSQLEEQIVTAGGVVIAAEAPRIATIGAYAMPGVESASQLAQLDLAGISVSAGSACSSGSMKPSRVLSAMGIPADVARSTIRVSFGPSTSTADIERLVAEWRRVRDRSTAAAA